MQESYGLRIQYFIPEHKDDSGFSISETMSYEIVQPYFLQKYIYYEKRLNSLTFVQCPNPRCLQSNYRIFTKPRDLTPFTRSMMTDSTIGLRPLDVHNSDGFVLYRYHPSLVAATIFVILFVLSTGMHIFQASKNRSRFCIPLIIGVECAGYLGRALAHFYQYSLGLYITQTLLLLVAPALFAASIYMTLGRLILLTAGEAVTPIRAKWLTKIFVCGDAISFCIQAGGGGLMASDKTMMFGKRLVVIGLLLQIIFFGVFMATSSIFHHQMSHNPTPSSSHNNWEPYIYVLYAVSTMVLVRSVFRVIEFSGGNDGVLLRNEVFLYVFDGVLMSGVMISFNVIHPGVVINKEKLGASFRMTERPTPEAIRSHEPKMIPLTVVRNSVRDEESLPPTY